MKKLILVAIVVMAATLVMAEVAFANGGPHGGYDATTDACAGCHRAHTATGPNLLVVASTYDLCISCHGNAGNGADSNVLDGIWLEGRNAVDTTGDAQTALNADLLGGGFDNYQGAPVTSSHDPNGLELGAWGYGANRGVTANLAEGLSCASCHDPHGSNNYRIMNEFINGDAVTMAPVDEGLAKDYDTEQWGAGSSTVCAACHDAYHQTTAGQGSTLDNGTYTHRVDMAYNYGGNADPEAVGMGGYTLPLAEVDQVVCMTCHLPHGTSVQMTGNADGAGLPGETSATDSALLRIEDRGVCEVCHQK